MSGVQVGTPRRALEGRKLNTAIDVHIRCSVVLFAAINSSKKIPEEFGDGQQWVEARKDVRRRDARSFRALSIGLLSEPMTPVDVRPSELIADTPTQLRFSTHIMDLTSDLNLILKSHDSTLVRRPEFRVDDLDEFLKEAYRIVGHVALQPKRG